MCCFEQLLEVVPHKAVAIWLLTFNLTKHQSKMNKQVVHHWRNKDEFINDILSWIPTNGCPTVGWSVNTFIHQLCADTRWRCLWCNGYRRRKWTRWNKFKSWTKLIAFHIALIPLGKVWIQLFSLQLWVNSRTDWVLQPWWGNKSTRRKTLNSNLLNSA